MSVPFATVRIKICGVTHEEHVHAAAEGGAHLVGLVLWERSPRALTVDQARDLAQCARSRGLETVALVVDAPLPRELDVDHVQCHGGERCEALATFGRPVIKGFSFSTEALRAWDACASAAWLLVDGPRGGSGAGFDHAELAALMPSITKPVLLAGGLTPTTVGAAITRVRPFGVDVSSGVERTRGVKDPELIRAFCRAVREAGA